MRRYRRSAKASVNAVVQYAKHTKPATEQNKVTSNGVHMNVPKKTAADCAIKKATFNHAKRPDILAFCHALATRILLSLKASRFRNHASRHVALTSKSHLPFQKKYFSSAGSSIIEKRFTEYFLSRCFFLPPQRSSSKILRGPTLPLH